MSLITKCPACTTMFKVVPDQLRVSDGWVRCGQCNEVFDANLNLQAAEAIHIPETQTAEHGPEPTQLTPPAPAPAEFAEANDDQAESESFLAVNPHALHFEPEVQSDPMAEPHLETGETDHVSASQQLAQGDDSLSGESVLEHSFLQRKETPSVWKRRSVRAGLSLFALLLGVTLVLQVVLHERDRIAAALPETKAAVEALCGAVGCAVAPLRQIESIQIDSSSFTKVRADVYRLSFALKNTAHISIATPALELTLTDMQDQAVVRRVFTAMDFGDKSGVLQAGAELSVTVPLSVKLAGSPEKVSGYRLLSFYP
jgi:predicted Zn finger-like uncharacterized protein